MDGVGEVDPSQLLSLMAAISYGVASMAMVFINKAILMKYAYSLTLLTLQQVATALVIHLGRVVGYTKLSSVNLATAKKLFPVSLFYNANVAFALASLKGVNIPMYIALKRLTPLAVLVAGFFLGKGRPPMQVSLSVLVTALGVIIAALGDFSFDFFGYTMALTSVFFQTMYLVLVEKSSAEDGLSSVEIMFYNAILSLPFLLFLIIATGEFPQSLSLLIEKVVTCGNVPLESSFQKVPRCVYTSTSLYEYRGWDSKAANSQHRRFTWGLRSVEVLLEATEGQVHKKDVMKASVMLERKKEYATILAFDVKVMPEARELAEETGVRIFVTDIIYHLFDQFKAYIDNLREEKKKESVDEAVFSCVLKIMPNCLLNKKDPIVLGVNVLEGIAKVPV